MAIFNPQIQTPNDPSYLKYSQGYEDKTFESALKGISSILDTGVKGADTLAKIKLRKKAEDEIEPLREGFTKSMEIAKTLVTGRSPSGDRETDSTSILPFAEETPQAPREVQQGVKTIGGIESSRANGKLSETEYYMKLEAVAKSMRTKYPGYREYIDKEISEIVGGTPANLYWKSLQADLNTYAQGKDSDKEKALNFLRTHAKELPKAAELIAGITSGQTLPQSAYDYANPILVGNYDVELKKRAREERLGGRADNKDNAIDELNTIGVNTFKNFMHSIQFTPGIPTLKDLQEKAFRIMKGLDPMPTQQQADQIAMAIRSQMGAASAEMQEKVRVGKNGRTILKDIQDPNEVDRLIAGHTKPFEHLASMISTNRWDLAAEAMNTVQALTNNTKRDLYTHETIGKLAQLQTAMTGIGGESFQRKITESVLTDGKLGEFKTWTSQQFQELATQPDLRTKGLKTMQDVMDNARRLNIKVPEVYSKFIDWVTETSEPDVGIGAKLNVYHATFDPKNRGLINTFGREGVDEKGNAIGGQYYVFRQLTSGAISKDIKNLSERDGVLKQNYRDWAEGTFNQLFSREIADLGGVIATSGRDFSIVWDTENKQFVPINLLKQVKLPDGRSAANHPDLQSRFEFIQRTVNRINMGLTNMNEMANTVGITGNNVDSYLLGVLQQRGVQFKSGVGEGNAIEGIPEQMARAIASSKAREDLKKKNWNIK